MCCEISCAFLVTTCARTIRMIRTIRTMIFLARGRPDTLLVLLAEYTEYASRQASERARFFSARIKESTRSACRIKPTSPTIPAAMIRRCRERTTRSARRTLALCVQAGPSHAIHVEGRERVRSATAILAPVRPARPVRPASRPTKIQKHTRPLAPPPPDGAGERARCCRMSRQRIRADSQGARAKKLPRFRD